MVSFCHRSGCQSQEVQNSTWDQEPSCRDWCKSRWWWPRFGPTYCPSPDYYSWSKFAANRMTTWVPSSHCYQKCWSVHTYWLNCLSNERTHLIELIYHNARKRNARCLHGTSEPLKAVPKWSAHIFSCPIWCPWWGVGSGCTLESHSADRIADLKAI